MKRALICGAGGFIGGQLVKRLKAEGYWVRGVDLKAHEFATLPADEFIVGDLRDPALVASVVTEGLDESYQFAADMGGAGYIFTGEQTRTFLHIDESIEGVRRLMQSDFEGPVNIGSDELISINDLARMTAEIAGKKVVLKHIEGPLGVRGRRSDNRLIEEKLGWRPTRPLREGMEKTYRWIEEQVRRGL